MSGYSCKFCKHNKILMNLFGIRFCLFCRKNTLNDILITLSEEISLRENLGLKVKSPLYKRFKSWITIGWEQSHLAKDGVNKTRIFDKENNKYMEKVEDYRTGKILHKCEEKLSDHIGHGSAKIKT